MEYGAGYQAGLNAARWDDLWKDSRRACTSWDKEAGLSYATDKRPDDLRGCGARTGDSACAAPVMAAEKPAKA